MNQNRSACLAAGKWRHRDSCHSVLNNPPPHLLPSVVMHLGGFLAQSTVILSHLFYLLFTPWCFSQVTSPATEISQSTFAAHSKYNKQLYFPGIFFLYYFLHSIKTIASYLSRSQDLLEIIAISHTYYIFKNNKKANRQRHSSWTLCGHRSQCEQDKPFFLDKGWLEVTTHSKQVI